jgi:hypothetical protein
MGRLPMLVAGGLPTLMTVAWEIVRRRKKTRRKGEKKKTLLGL